MGEAAQYVDIYSVPVKTARIDEYRESAKTFGSVVVELGGRRYREFAIDDPGEGHEPVEGETLVGTLIEFGSKQERDSIMDAVMKDPRIVELMKADADDYAADMGRAVLGGYSVLVDL